MNITMMEHGSITTKLVNSLVKQSKYSKLIKVQSFKSHGKYSYSPTAYYTIYINNKITNEIILSINVAEVDYSKISNELVKTNQDVLMALHKYWNDNRILQTKLEMISK